MVPATGGKDLTASTGPTEIEAEEAELIGAAAITTEGTGYTGTGYANMLGQEGGIVWLVSIPNDGEYLLSFRQAQNEGRDMALNVNCTEVKSSILFSTTGSWDSVWVTDPGQVATLHAGTNRIALMTNGDSGPNFDKMIIERQ